MQCLWHIKQSCNLWYKQLKLKIINICWYDNFSKQNPNLAKLHNLKFSYLFNCDILKQLYAFSITSCKRFYSNFFIWKSEKDKKKRSTVLLQNNPIDSFECIRTHLEKWTMQIFYFTFHTRTKFPKWYDDIYNPFYEVLDIFINIWHVHNCRCSLF